VLENDKSKLYFLVYPTWLVALAQTSKY